MPWGDGTGPWWGRRNGGGFHGYGWRGRGYGYGPRWFDYDYPDYDLRGWYRGRNYHSLENEKILLEERAERLKEELAYINKRLEDLK